MTNRKYPQLLALRNKLDTIDADIIRLLEERFKTTDEVADFKNSHDIPLSDYVREAEMVSDFRAQISHPVLKEHIADIYRQIIDLNKTARQFSKTITCPFETIGIIGLGVIGGSIIKALKMKKPTYKILSLKRDSADLSAALEKGYVDDVVESYRELVNQCDIIILSTPIHTIPEIARTIAQVCPQKKLLVIDTASIKSPIVKVFESLNRPEIEFIGTHPMAGSEQIGFNGANALLFVKKPWVITPLQSNSTQAISHIQEFISYLGSQPVIRTAQEHDDEVASVSHLVFLFSTFLFSFVYTKKHDALQLAGSGFESITRLASGSPQMHQSIVEGNYEAIAANMVEFMEYVKQLPMDTSSLLQYFKKMKDARDSFINSAKE